MGQESATQLLLVEDRPADRALVARVFPQGLTVVSDAAAALDAARKQTFAAMMVSYALPGRSGLQLLHALREAGDPTPVVLLTEAGEDAVARAALRDGAAGCVVKQVGFEQRLRETLAGAARPSRAHVVAPERVRRHLLVFRVGPMRHAIPVAEVEEVLPAVPIAGVPGAPAGVEGVITLRGRLVPVLDVRAQLGLPPKPVEHRDHLIVARAGAALVAVRADEAIEIACLEVTVFAPDAGLALHACGVAQTDAGPVFVQDLNRLVGASALAVAQGRAA